MPISPNWFYGSDYLFAVLCAAFALELLVGGLPGFCHVLSLPQIITSAFADRADRRLNRQKRSVRSRKTRGVLLVIVLILLAATAGFYGAEFCRSLADGWIVETVLISMCVGLQRPVMNAGAMRRALARKSIDRARAVLGRAVGYETDTARAMWLYLIAGYLGIAPLVVLALVAHHI
jgi:cobalamin biosynthesis protein CobD/CbiB